YGGGICVTYYDWPIPNKYTIIESNTISENNITGGYNGGGGIEFWGVDGRIVNNTIRKNSSQYAGGIEAGNLGGWGFNTVLMQGNLVQENHAIKNCGAINAQGGGSSIAIRSNTIINNMADLYIGGIVIADSCTAVIDRNYISHNTSTGGGNAIYLYRNDKLNLITNNIITGHSGLEGHAIELGDGAGFTSSAVLINNTIVGNEAAVNAHSNSNSKVYLLNNIIWNSRSTELYGTVYASYNLIKGGYAGTGNIDADPRFAANDPLYRLSDSSYAIGRGTDSVQFGALWYRAPSTDYFGSMRPNPAASNPDLGASENQRATTYKELTAPSLPAGTYAVGSGGNFADLDAAFDRLSRGGILGEVTLLLTDTGYTAFPWHNRMFTLLGPIVGAGPSSRVIIRPADNVAATIRGSGEAVLLFRSVSYLTLDGVSLEGSTRLTVTAAFDTRGTRFNDAVTFVGDCDSNIVQNLIARSDDPRWSGGVSFYADGLGASDNCIISGVYVPSAVRGLNIYPLDYATAPAELWTNYNSTGMVLRGNRIGSPECKIMSAGIRAVFLQDSFIEILAGTHNTIVRGNVIHDMNGKQGGTVAAIKSHFDVTRQYTGREIGSGLQIYNNMIYAIRCEGDSGQSMVSGIWCKANVDPRIAYNTIVLDGESSLPGGTAALRFGQDNQRVTIRNNILVNLSQQTATSSGGFSTAIQFDNGLEQISACDHNDLYVGSYETNRLVMVQSLSFSSLGSWQSSGFDEHSISLSPVFTPPHLHIDTTASVNASLAHAGVSIPGLEFDFDGDRRLGNPDIGADQFSKTATIVEEQSEIPAVFALEQNYPNPFNPTTNFEFRIANLGLVKLLVFDLLGREVAVLVNEEKPAGTYRATWDAGKMSSGVYFYRLTAGEFVETKKMVLLR
ncbi:MAG: 5'-Nucleotidase domain protein, partial [Bacteroidetes bacterium]|nr:5'-Nucleotidase domain protein [Bacteroidota bacterium]